MIVWKCFGVLFFISLSNEGWLLDIWPRWSCKCDDMTFKNYCKMPHKRRGVWPCKEENEFLFANIWEWVIWFWSYESTILVLEWIQNDVRRTQKWFQIVPLYLISMFVIEWFFPESLLFICMRWWRDRLFTWWYIHL